MFVAPAWSHAKVERDHSRDVKAVIGISGKDPATQARYDEVLRFISTAIDNQGEFKSFYADKIKAEPRFDAFGKWYDLYSHRILFHWGYYRFAPDVPLLQQCVEECGWDATTKDLFLRVVGDEYSRRCGRMAEEVGKVLGLSTRRHIRAITLIIYDTHILGDYIEQTGDKTDKPLVSLDDLVKEFHRALYADLRAGDDAKELRKDLDAVTGSHRERAERILDLLKQRLPGIISNAEDGFSRRQIEEAGFEFSPRAADK
jgi:hypothetical protein